MSQAALLYIQQVEEACYFRIPVEVTLMINFTADKAQRLEALARAGNENPNDYAAIISEPVGGPPAFGVDKIKMENLAKVLQFIHDKPAFLAVIPDVFPPKTFVKVIAEQLTRSIAQLPINLIADYSAVRKICEEYAVEVALKAKYENKEEDRTDEKRREIRPLAEETIALLVRLKKFAELKEFIAKANRYVASTEGLLDNQKLLTALKEKFQAEIKFEKMLESDPVLAREVEGIKAERDAYVETYGRLKAALDIGDITVEDLANLPDYKQLKDTSEKQDKIQKEYDKSTRDVKFYESFFAEQAKKREDALKPLLSQKEALLKTKEESASKLAKAAPEDVAIVTNEKVKIQNIQEKLASVESQIDYYQTGQEKEQKQLDEIYLFDRMNALWIANEKSKSTKNPSDAWMETFIPIYKNSTGFDLDKDLDRLAYLRGVLGGFNTELQELLNTASSDKWDNNKTNARIQDLANSYNNQVEANLFEIVISGGIQRLTEKESIGFGTSQREIPKFKSLTYLQAKADALKPIRDRRELLAKAFIVENPQNKVEKSPAKKAIKYDQGFSLNGVLQLKLADKAPESDKRIGKVSQNKDTLVGLVVKLKDKGVNFVMPDKMDIPEGFDQLGIGNTFVPETTQKQYLTEQAFGEYWPNLSAFSQEQIDRLANFIGPDFASTFDATSEDHVAELTGELKAKLGNSKLTMADILLVAYGFRYRNPDVLREFNQLKADGFKFHHDIITKGDEFFADEVTLSQQHGFEGEKQDPITVPMTVNRPFKDGGIVAKINSRDAGRELDALTQRIKDRMPALSRAFDGLREAADGNERDADYRKYVKEADALVAQIPREHHQKPIFDFLMTNPDIYSAEGKQAFANAYAESVARFYSIKLIEKQLDKLVGDIEKSATAKIDAKHKLKEDADAEENKEAEIVAIRKEIKLDFFGDENMAENERQTARLDRAALDEYERKHGKTQTVTQRVEQQVGDVRGRIDQIRDRIEVVKVKGSPEELEALRRDMQRLEEENARLLRELEAIRQLQQQRAMAQETPETVYQRTHSVDDMLRQAALQHIPRLDTNTLANFVKTSEKGKGTIAGKKFKEAQSKIEEYNKDPAKYGFK